MDLNFLILTVYIPVHIFLIFLIKDFGEYPAPLPHSENPRKEYLETVIYTLIVIFYFVVKIFVLNRFTDSFYIELCFRTIIFLLIPLAYVRYRDHWTSEDLGFISKVKSPQIVIISIMIYTTFGLINTLTIEISWYLLLIYFYSNAFLEEFLFRGVIQSKLERASGQKKAIICQAFMFMLIHIPVNRYNFLLDNNFSDIR